MVSPRARAGTITAEVFAPVLALLLSLLFAAAPASAQLVADARSAVGTARPSLNREIPPARSGLAPLRSAVLQELEGAAVPWTPPPPPHRGLPSSVAPFVGVGAMAGMIAGTIWAVQQARDCGFPGACVLLVPMGMAGGMFVGGAAGFVVWAATRPFVRRE